MKFFTTRAPAIPQVCRGCGKPFMAHATVQVACSEECKFLMYQNKGESGACWEWSGPLLGGYGLLFLSTNKVNGRRETQLAHRYSYLRSHGALPDGKPCVLHSCDNPKCTNPAHLRAGTRGENNAERSAKGRSGRRDFTPEERQRYSDSNRGQKNNYAKLTEDAVRQIKYGYQGMTQKEIAQLHSVSTAAVGAIRTGRNWRHV